MAQLRRSWVLCIVILSCFTSTPLATATSSSTPGPTSSSTSSSCSSSATVQADMRFIQDFWSSGNTTKARPDRSNDASGVTIYPASHSASRISDVETKNVSEILDKIRHGEPRGPIIQSSIKTSTSENNKTVIADENGFLYGAIAAYSSHHHLVLRPEDIWLAILTQFSAYVNAHSEELRGSFVAHEGKQELIIQYPEGMTRHEIDWAEFATFIGMMIQDNIVDPDLRAWILPNFSTTTKEDEVVASIVMMATLQAYFEYTAMMTCGIPSVTLLGSKSDYENILLRTEKLKTFGTEPSQFADLLTPVLKRFIASFEDPENKDIISFWNRIFTSWDSGSGTPYFSGWITAFAFWDKDGSPTRDRDYVDELPPLYLDGVRYHRMSADDVPPGFSTVPVKIEGDGEATKAEMLAGSVAWQVWSSGKEMAEGGAGIDTLQPKAGWWIYEADGELGGRPHDEL